MLQNESKINSASNFPTVLRWLNWVASDIKVVCQRDDAIYKKVILRNSISTSRGKKKYGAMFAVTIMMVISFLTYNAMKRLTH